MHDVAKRGIDNWIVATTALHHHERFHGNGYPGNLRGDAIPPPARMVAVADAYDAIRSVRPYSPGRSHSEGPDEIQRSRNSHFDPGLAVTALANAPRLAYIYDRIGHLSVGEVRETASETLRAIVWPSHR